MSDVIKRLPWWGWALLVLVGVLVVLLSVPGLRDHAVELLGGTFAFAFGVRSTQRRDEPKTAAERAERLDGIVDPFKS